jgi:pimeloyl-ACP methyl ester carboxylesterase
MTYRNDSAAPAAETATYGFGLTEWPDLEAAVALMSPSDTDPKLLIVAESMGAAIAGQFLAQSPLAGRVKALALDSPAISFGAVLDHLATAGGKPLPGLLSWTTKQILPFKTSLPLDQAEVTATLTAFPGPVFIAHGAADSIVPIGPSQSLAAARTGKTATLWTGADHLGSFTEDPQAYTAALTGFLGDLPD